jgi:hypothetical protein
MKRQERWSQQQCKSNNSSSMKKPPPGSPSAISTDSYSANKMRGDDENDGDDDAFLASFDVDFIRQQKEMLAKIRKQQRQQQYPLLKSPPLASNAAEAPSPPSSSSTSPKLPSSSNSISNQQQKQNRYTYKGWHSNRSHSSQSMDSCQTRRTALSTPASSFYSSTCRSLSEIEESRDTIMSPSSVREIHHLYNQDDQQEDISRYIQDAQFIREQEEILNRIQNQSSNVSYREVCIDENLPSSSSTLSNRNSNVVSAIQVSSSLEDYFLPTTTPMDQQTLRCADISNREHNRIDDGNGRIQQRPVNPSVASATVSPHTRSRPSSNNNVMSQQQHGLEKETAKGAAAAPQRHHHVEDMSLQFGPNKKNRLRVKGTNDTYNAIARGKASLAQCSHCQCLLQIPSTAKLLFCVVCEEVTPITTTSDNFQYQNGTGNDYLVDAQISQVMQNIEIDVARARKLGKMYGNNNGGEGR